MIGDRQSFFFWTGEKKRIAYLDSFLFFSNEYEKKIYGSLNHSFWDVAVNFLLKVLTEGGIRHVNMLRDKAQMFDQYSEEISFQD